MKKKWIAILLTAAFTLSALTGCGNSDAQGTGNGDGTVVTATTGEEAGSEASGEEASNLPEGAVTFADIKLPKAVAQDDNYRNFYEIFVGSFYDSDGDKMGDLNGVTSKLDYVKALGFDAIWLMPIMPSNTYHKYDVLDYMAIDSAYGTMDDFDRMIAEAHGRGMKIIIDMVLNHSSSDHPWFKEACSYLRSLEEGQEPDPAECKYVDYYHFSKAKKTSDWYKVSGSDYFYEGVFWSEMPDLNLSSEALWEEIDAISDFWIAHGVDGFRMDAALHFEEDNTAYNTEALNRLYTYCKAQDPDFYMVSEVWASASTIASYYASETDSFFNFDTSQAEGKLISAARGSLPAASLVSAFVKYQDSFGAVYGDYIDAPFLSNHDTGRVANALNNNLTNMKRAAGYLLTMTGSPFVYYGEEIGMASSGTKDENKRLAMLWSDANDAGKTKNPSGADSGIKSSFAPSDEQQGDEASLLNYYVRALKIRNAYPEIARGKVTIVEELTEGQQAAITKTWNGETIAILYNTDKTEDVTFTLTGTALEGMEIAGVLTPDAKGYIILKDGVLTLPAGCIAYLK